MFSPSRAEGTPPPPPGNNFLPIWETKLFAHKRTSYLFIFFRGLVSGPPGIRGTHKEHKDLLCRPDVTQIEKKVLKHNVTANI